MSLFMFYPILGLNYFIAYLTFPHCPFTFIVPANIDYIVWNLKLKLFAIIHIDFYIFAPLLEFLNKTKKLTIGNI